MFSRPDAVGGGNGIHVIALDARTARDPSFSKYGTCKGADSKMLSQEQWSWLEEQMNLHSEIKVIASGVQVLPPTDLITTSPSKYCSYDGTNGTFYSSIAALGESENSRGTAYEKWSEFPQERLRLLQLCQRAINSGKAKVSEYSHL
jgi:alkaline phosphatase D